MTVATMKRRTIVWLMGLLLSASGGLSGLELKKMADETIALIPSADNGASPLWCFGSSIFVRDGDDLYLSLLQTDPGIPPSANCHWEIWKREKGEWKTLFKGGEGLEREPCPLVRMAPGELVLSTHPKVMEKPFHDGKGDIPWYSKPGLTGIFPDEEDNDAVYHHYHPVFQDGAQFSDTSYRGIGIDPSNREILLLVIDQRGDENFQVSWLRSDKGWESLPVLRFPIRACYPQVVLENRQGHVLAIGDIVEPVEEWREMKFSKLQRKWDYVFRRLFYTWSPDLGREPFGEPLEIDSVDATGGYMLNLDLYVDEQNRAHVLYLKKPYQYDFMRDRYFPGARMRVFLEYAVLQQGKVVSRRTLIEGSAEEGYPQGVENLHLWSGRLHALPDGSLGVLFSGAWKDMEGREKTGMFLSQLSESGKVEKTMELPVSKTLSGMYFTNTRRSGSEVGRHLDIVGAVFDGRNYEMRYLGFEIE